VALAISANVAMFTPPSESGEQSLHKVHMGGCSRCVWSAIAWIVFVISMATASVEKLGIEFDGHET
jgi:hypothetical protein